MASTTRSRITVVLSAILLMGPVTGCAGPPAAPNPPTATTAGEKGTPPMATPTGGGCLDGSVELRWAPDHPTPARLCVRPGTKIALRLYPPDLHRWKDPTSADSGVVRIGPFGLSQEGVLAATLTAGKTGETVVSSVAEPMPEAPDPGFVTWRMTIEVVAA
jgi:hypothetical protein